MTTMKTERESEIEVDREKERERDLDKLTKRKIIIIHIIK